MSRLTGREVANLLEAYSTVYAPQQEVVQESVEKIEEAVDVFSTPAMKAARAKAQQQAAADVLSGKFAKDTAKIAPNPTAPRNPLTLPSATKPSAPDVFKSKPALQIARDAASRQAAADVFKLKPGAGDTRGRGGDGNGRGGDGNGAPPPPPRNVISATNIAGQKQKVTVGTKYGATLDGQKGNVTYDASGKRTFTADKPAAAKPVATGMLGKTSYEMRRATPAEFQAAQAERERQKAAGEDTSTVANAERALQAAISAGRSEKNYNTMGKFSGFDPKNQAGAAAIGKNPLVQNAKLNTSDPGAYKPPAGSLPPSAAYTGPKLGATPAPAAAAPTSPVTPVNTSKAVAAATTKADPITPAQKTVAAAPGPGEKPKPLKQDIDLFDIVKGHLLDEGYADTEQAALAIMANMSEDWKQSIIEGVGGYDDPILGPHTPGGKLVRGGVEAAKKVVTGVVKGVGSEFAKPAPQPPGGLTPMQRLQRRPDPTIR